MMDELIPLGKTLIIYQFQKLHILIVELKEISTLLD